jgi:hypothetical protein
MEYRHNTEIQKDVSLPAVFLLHKAINLTIQEIDLGKIMKKMERERWRKN